MLRAKGGAAAVRLMAYMPSFAAARPEEILLPAKPWFVMLTLLVGLLCNLVPMSGVALMLKPDFLALVILYWCIQEPRLIGVGIAWCVGLVMDVADATVFGQHALAYAVLAYAAEYFRRRVLRFPLWQQAAQVAVLLLLCAGLVLLVRVVGGAPMPRWNYIVGPLVGALLWPVVTVVLQWPQRPRRSSGER
jgi:rod shape-determining protein MreD